MHPLHAIIILIWWALSVVIGFLVVPMLFALLPDKAVAGSIAARFFEIVHLATILISLILFIATKHYNAILKVVLALACMAATFSQFIAAPKILARKELAFWHSAASISYVIIVLCATVYLFYLLKKINKN